MIYKVLPVKQNCFSRLQGIKVHAGDGCFTTTVHPPCNDTVPCGSIIFLFGGKSPSAVRTVTTGNLQRSSLRGRCHSQRYGVFRYIQRDSKNARTPWKRLHEVGHPFPVSNGLSHILEVHEVPQLQAFLTEARELDSFRTSLQILRRSYGLDTLLQSQQTPTLEGSQPYRHLITTTASCTLTITLILYCFLRARFRHSLCNVTRRALGYEPSTTNYLHANSST